MHPIPLIAVELIKAAIILSILLVSVIVFTSLLISSRTLYVNAPIAACRRLCLREYAQEYGTVGKWNVLH